MEFYALIEEWPRESMVFFRELPGCFASAPTTEEAIQAAPAAIAQYFSWLRANELAVIEEDSSPVKIVIKELLSSTDKSNGPLFTSDKIELSELEIDYALNVAATARALIIEIIANIPAHLYEQTLTSDTWSLYQHLHHVMETENWYVSRLQKDPHVEPSISDMSADDVAMKIFADAMDNEIILRDLPSEQRTGIFIHDDETWTAAKVFRRQTGHLREHLLAIEALEIQLSTPR